MSKGDSLGLENQNSNPGSVGSGKSLKNLPRAPKFYFCDLCPEKCNRKYLLRIHRAHAHGEKLTHVCSVCSKSFALEYKLRIHMKTHNDRKYSCTYPECGFHSDKWSALRKHVATEHSTMVCTTCGKRFKRNENLVAHRQTKHPEQSTVIRLFSCDRPGCSKSYTRETSLKTHQRNSHDEPKFVCIKCNSKFRHKKTLKDHETKCGSKPEKEEKRKEPEKKKKPPTKRKRDRMHPFVNESQFNEADWLALEHADIADNRVQQEQKGPLSLRELAESKLC